MGLLRTPSEHHRPLDGVDHVPRNHLGARHVRAAAVVWVLCAMETALSASQRGHRWWGWLVCGLLLGPLAWCFAMSLEGYRRTNARASR